MKLCRCILFMMMLSYPALCKSQQLPSKHEQYNFLNWYLSYKKFEAISDTVSLFNTINDRYSMGRNLLQNLKLSQVNVSYIKFQALHNKRTILDTIDLPGTNWQMKERRYYISLPVFTVNKKTVLICWGYECGFECGKSGIEAYIKTKNGKWRAANVPFPIVVY